MIILIGVGMYISRNEVFSLYPLHKSVGVILFIIILARVVIRMRKDWSENVSGGAAWEQNLAHVIHWVLILAILAMPISGMMYAVMAGRGLSVFSVDLIAANLNTEGQSVVIREGGLNAANAVHGIVGKILFAAILLHIAGALKYHMVDRDGTLARMMGRT